MRSYCFPVTHNRWLSLDEAGDGKLEYDRLLADEDVEFDGWRLDYRTQRFAGAAIDAVNQGDNTIAITTTNVARSTVWLQPKMIDGNEPVEIIVDGKTQFHDTVEPSLVTALDSYERRCDWGLIYPIKIEIDGTAELND